MARNVIPVGSTKVALIDGLPLYIDASYKVVHNDAIQYSWDSDFFGIPEYRLHGMKMARTILKENSKAEILIFPFFPFYNSVFKNYRLLAKSIIKAVDYNCDIICLCLEVLSVNYLSSEMLNAYKYAYNNEVIICVSAGNNRLFKNPLIHKKYTTPVLGLMEEEKFKNDHGKSSFKFMSYDEIDPFLEIKNKKMNCSMATAFFCGWLSKEENSIKGKPVVIYSELQDY